MLDIIHHIKIDISRGKGHNLRRYLIRPAFPTVLECIRHAAVRSERTGRQRTGWKGDKWKQPGLLPSQGKTTVLTQNPVGIGNRALTGIDKPEILCYAGTVKIYSSTFVIIQFLHNSLHYIHDLTKKDLDKSIVYIENGHVSNRHTGDGPSGIVLETLRSDPARISDKLAYLTKTDDGRILKSSTLYIRNDESRIAYIFSMNFDITSLLAAENLIHGLLRTKPEADSGPDEADTPQRITHNVTELLDLLIEQAIAKVGKPVALMNKDDKIAVVQYLNNAGAFLITKSGDKVSSLLGISKFTLYSYMDKG